ncbi:outer membrane protein assembly factor BamE domain-containing protein [Alishewanella sp. d11]|uniref:outer membrane protein assembly factor BamE domain-containing protein n=1 Tax=Alishewanella sp. d11 TaxID=3414030 RepID=UPI003BF8DBE3
MKILTTLFILLMLTGCATANYELGNPINPENVAKIENGKTTKQELISLFGEPYTKTPLSSTQEKWIYTYINTTAKAQSYVVTMKVDSTGIQQTLDLLIENGVVLNHTFVNGEIPKIKTN